MALNWIQDPPTTNYPTYRVFAFSHCKCFDHKDYKDWKFQGTCRENLHYLWKMAMRIPGFPHNSYKCKNCGETLQFLQSFFIDSADFPCRSPAISSPCSLYGQNICSALLYRLLKLPVFFLILYTVVMSPSGGEEFSALLGSWSFPFSLEISLFRLENWQNTGAPSQSEYIWVSTRNYIKRKSNIELV